MQTFLLLVLVSGLTLLGDFCIKLATGHEGGLNSPVFLAGALFYGLPAVGWFFLMKSHSLAAVGVFYSASTLLLLAALGVVVFKEAFGVREALGLSLAVASVVVMSSGG